MKTLIVMCGASGSGKTTLSKKIEKEHNAVRLSGDETGYRPKKLSPMVADFLVENDVVIVDYLCTRISTRKLLLDAIKHIECKKVLVFLNTPLEECVRRNSLKKYPLSSFIVEDIHRTLQQPLLDEGWDEIVEVINNEKTI